MYHYQVFSASLADLQMEAEILDKAWDAAVIEFERKQGIWFDVLSTKFTHLALVLLEYLLYCDAS